jgi:hypothetical protein
LPRGSPPTDEENNVARQIKLTRDERIVLKQAIDNGGSLMDVQLDVMNPRFVSDKLVHRGLLTEDGDITSEGLRAMAENRQTQPKAVR